MLSAILWAFLRGEIILEVLEMPSTLQNPKWAVATIITLAQKLTKNHKNQWAPNISLFPLIPTRATPTKLAQKLENIQNQWKPCSTSQSLRRQNDDPGSPWSFWLCLNMCPASSARRETLFGRLITAAYLSLEKTVKNYSEIPYISLSSWNNIFFDVKVCQNNTLLFWDMLTGVYP